MDLFFVRATGTGTVSVVSSVSMMIKWSLVAMRLFRGGFDIRGGIGGKASGGASKLLELFVVDESFAMGSR